MDTSSSNTNTVLSSIRLPASHFIPAPFSSLLQLSGLFSNQPTDQSPSPPTSPPLTIRIIGPSDNNPNNTNDVGDDDDNNDNNSNYSIQSQPVDSGASGADSLPESSTGDEFSSSSSSSSSSRGRYDMGGFALFVEQFLPFALLLVLVFIRQHIQGFCIAVWTAVVLFKSNDVLRKQTALKGERKTSVLLGMVIVFLFHALVIYWCYWSDGLVFSLIFVPPKLIPPFWHAVFIIMVNDAMVRLLGMAFKCVLLLYYKNSRAQNYRKQGQMLTLVEYALLVYRMLLPTPVWYRFFLNKEYGSFFSSLITGLYLTFKLVLSLRQVQLFFAALRALSRKEMLYGSYATADQVNAAGDLCAICQEKMQTPILLRCKHIFCEECASEWFDRERTCPLCRALIRPADIRSYSDGSTTLFFQLY